MVSLRVYFSKKKGVENHSFNAFEKRLTLSDLKIFYIFNQPNLAKIILIVNDISTFKFKHKVSLDYGMAKPKQKRYISSLLVSYFEINSCENLICK